MVPARQQTVGRKPQLLVLLFGKIDQVGGGENIAYLVSYRLIRPTMGAAVEQ